MTAFEKVADSGSRQEFTTGAVRDTQDGKPRPDLISPMFTEAVANSPVPDGLNIREYMDIIISSVDTYGKTHDISNLASCAKALTHVLYYQENLIFWCGGKLLPPTFYNRLGYWLMLGAKKYKEFNWVNGINLTRSYASLKRHLDEWRSNWQNEDHAAAMLCNLMFLHQTKWMIDNGKLPKTLDDFREF